MNKITITYLFLFPLFLLAQPKQRNHELRSQIHTLKQQIDPDHLSTHQLQKIIRLRSLYGRVDLDSAIYYVDIEIRLATRMKEIETVANARLIKSGFLWRMQKPEDANDLLMQNVNHQNRISDTTMARTFFKLAQVQIQRKKPSESVKFVNRASQLYLAIGDSVNVAECHAHIAGIYTFVLAEPEKAIVSFDTALRYNNGKNSRNSIRCHINYSSALMQLLKFEEAIKQVENAEEIAIETNNFSFYPSIYIQYAQLYNSSENYVKSLRYALKADSITEVMSIYDPKTTDKINWYKALNYKELKNYTEAIKSFDSLKDSPALLPWDIQEHLVEIYQETGDYEKAFLLQRQIQEAKDSLDAIALNEKTTEIIERYENAQKNREIIALNTEKELQREQIKNQRYLLYGTICFFLIFIAFVFFWNRARVKLRETRLSLEKTQLQQRFLRTQLNPHFFFHALTSIEAYIYKNDSNRSASFLRNFSLLMRNILEFSDVDFIPLRQDIDFIERYLKLQQLNHEFRFNYEIKIGDKLDLDSCQIPPMLIQPAVENAILHGLSGIENGRIIIRFSREETNVLVTIQNNGNTKQEGAFHSNRLHRSMSQDITKMRIKNLYDVHGINIDYHPFHPNATLAETIVMFKVPLTI